MRELPNTNRHLDEYISNFIIIIMIIFIIFSSCPEGKIVQSESGKNARSSGKTMWPQLSQICRPFSRILIGLN